MNAKIAYSILIDAKDSRQFEIRLDKYWEHPICKI
jgi:hypothetical protein